MLFSNLHSHHTGEGRGFLPILLSVSCLCLLVCVYVFEGFLGFLCFVGLFLGVILIVCCCLCLAYLEVVSCCFMGCVGKGHSWTSSVRVSSHGERKEKRVECMGLYLPPLACMVVKLRLKGLASL